MFLSHGVDYDWKGRRETKFATRVAPETGRKVFFRGFAFSATSLLPAKT